MLTEWGRIRIWDINVEYFFCYTMITEIQSVGPEIVIHFREKCQMKSRGEKKPLPFLSAKAEVPDVRWKVHISWPKKFFLEICELENTWKEGQKEGDLEKESYMC